MVILTLLIVLTLLRQYYSCGRPFTDDACYYDFRLAQIGYFRNKGHFSLNALFYHEPLSDILVMADYERSNNMMTGLFIAGAVGFCAFLGAAIIKTIC